MVFPRIIKRVIFISVISLFCKNLIAQKKHTPWLFRWQDNLSKKHAHHYLRHDTLLQTSDAILHIGYNKDTLKPYLLLLHGMGANARSNWYKQVKGLSNDFNLIMPDLIYFGESSSSSQNMSVEFQVQQLHEAILNLGITTKIHVMGFSYGGLTAAMYNELFPETVNRLIIIDGPVKFYSGATADSLARIVGLKDMSHVIVPQTPEEFQAMQKAVMSTSFPATKKMKRKIIAYIFTPTRPTREKQLTYLIEHQLTYQNLSYHLDKTPTLLVWGAKDGVVPLSVGTALHKAFPVTTQLLVFPEAKHDVHFREPKKLNKAVIEFLKH